MEQHFDVIVAGGGTAGVTAAIAAARNGAKTLLVERFGHLGGTAVCGVPFLGMFDCAADRQATAGLAAELIDRMREAGGCLGPVTGARWADGERRFSLVPFEPEVYKYVAQEMALEAGAELLLHTFIEGAFMDGDAVRGIRAINKSGSGRLWAPVVIDATGDADVAFSAGVPMQEKDRLQNASSLLRVAGVDLAAFRESLIHSRGISGWGHWHTRLVEKEKLDGGRVTPVHLAGHFSFSDGREVTFTAVSLRDDEIFLNATRTTGVDGGSARSLTLAEISERRHAAELINRLREEVPGFERAYLVSSSPVGIRESRNILGEYVLTREDVLNAVPFPDCVVRGAYPIDIHDPKGGRTQFMFVKDGGSYGIPYRCFVPRGIDGLLVAGRCLSADHEAMGTARIMGAVMGQGEAVGTAAALAVRTGVSPRRVDIEALRSALRSQGAILEA